MKTTDLLVNRQSKFKITPFTHLAFDPDLSIVFFNKLFAEYQTQSGSFFVQGAGLWIDFWNIKEFFKGIGAHTIKCRCSCLVKLPSLDSLLKGESRIEIELNGITPLDNFV